MDEMESESHILGLNDDPVSHNFSYGVGSALGTKRLHLDSESSVDDVGNLSVYITDKRIKLENTSEDEDDGSSGLIQGNECNELGGETGIMLGSAASEVMSSEPVDLTFNNENENSGEDVCVLIHHMDIKEPLSSLRKALEETHNVNLNEYSFYLQDTTPLADHKNLVEQCVQGVGTVQINLEIKAKPVNGIRKINIIDVLKPSDSYLLATGDPAFSPDVPEESSPTEDEDSDKNLIRWIVDNNFKENQIRLQIPEDPMDWDVSHVRHWLLWAVRQFNLTGINLSDWQITGEMLCSLTLAGFKARVPYDPADIFWTHLELLRRCRFVAVMQNPEEVMKDALQKNQENDTIDKNIMRSRERKPKLCNKPPVSEQHVGVVTLPPTGWGVRNAGTNGQVQLWQFLLDLLTDKKHRGVIQWLGAEGEFKLMEPEQVAQLWGLRKNKPSMNYEKLSRALRYYYDGDMIAKVHGKRFVYKFVCDLKQLLGYSAFELNRLVIEAEMRSQNTQNDPLQPSIFRKRKFST